MKQLLDLVPAVAFFLGWVLYDIYVATAAVIVALIGVVIAYGVIERRLHKMHAFAAAVATVFGSLTLVLRDPVFIQFKPSLVYCCFALLLAGSHFVGDKVLLQRIPQHTLVMPDANWRKLNAAWAVFFLAIAALNLYLVYFQTEAVWVHFRTWGYSVLTMLFLASTLPFLMRYLQETAAEHERSTSDDSQS
ncbi:MAG: septation protein IspZ [Algiphilus sp.]|nr:septation protein IspZ [Algiphilus sp.]MCI5102646.1 septation protein IspZ [Algiphilus sp.]